eukprot:COSAG02_NODE_13194_length_1429_cov_1.121053_1_plen_331_part_00
MLQEFHDVGLIMWHNKPQTRELVVLDIQWMIDQMTELLCRRSIEQKENVSFGQNKARWVDLRRKGRLSIDLLPELWPALEPVERQSVLNYMINFGLCCLLHDASHQDVEQIDRSTFLVPSLLPRSPGDDVDTVWRASTDDCHARVRFATAHDLDKDSDWAEEAQFLPDTLYFRLVATLVHDVKRASDAFKHLYIDRVVITTANVRYLLVHNREQSHLELTVYAGERCRSAPAVVKTRLDECISRLQVSCGLRYRYRFEIECERLGETSWQPLDDLAHDEIGYVWLADVSSIVALEPEPENDLGVAHFKPVVRRNAGRETWDLEVCQHLCE